MRILGLSIIVLAIVAGLVAVIFATGERGSGLPAADAVDTSRIDASELARSVGLSASDAARELIELERAGLVDATRARLTMPGLARAVALESGGGGAPAVDLRHARPRPGLVKVQPVAAQPFAEERTTPLRPCAGYGDKS